ncbi:histidine kinase N-terminal 7TM domain-containing protein [Natrialbaceae archaeon A-CW2]
MVEGSLFTAGLVMATVFSLVLGGMTWQYRERPGAKPFLLLVAGLAIWSGGTFLASIDPSFERTLIWYRLTYAGIPTVVLGWFLFALEFTGRGNWINRRTLSLLAIEPIAVQFVVWTHGWHDLFWRDVSSNPLEQAVYGDLFWIHALYSYGLLLVGTILLLSFVLYSKTLYRDQVLAIMVAITIPWGANMVYLFTSFQADLTPLAIGVSAGAFAWSMFRYGFMDVVPVARETVIDEMNDGVLVLDLEGRIVDLNRAIVPLLETGESDAVGASVTSTLALSRMRALDFQTHTTSWSTPVDLADDPHANAGALEAFFDGDVRSERTIEIEVEPQGQANADTDADWASDAGTALRYDAGAPGDRPPSPGVGEGGKKSDIRRDIEAETPECRNYALTLSPFYAQKESLTGQLLVAQDITIRKHRERQLERLADELERQSKEQAALIENLPGIVYRLPSVTADSCSFVSQAAEAVTGYGPETFESGERSLHELVHGDDRQQVLEQKRSAVANGERYDVTYRIRSAGDGQRWVRDVGEGIVTGDGELASVVGVILDVTENKEREQLQVLNRVLRHNIRNEMNVIKGYASMAAKQTSGEVRDGLHIVERKSEMVMRMSEKARIVQQLLGTPAGANRGVDVFGALSDALYRLDDQHGDRIRGRVSVTANGELDARADGDDPLKHSLHVYGCDLLALGLYELLENAVVHGGDSPTIDITVTSDAETAELRIADSGSGIPDTERDVIDAGLESPLEHGSGMGLWISQWILTPYADLTFDSDDDGTVVTVCFDRFDDESSSDEQTSDSENTARLTWPLSNEGDVDGADRL